MLNYSSLVLDCDGVILNSNKIKTEAFRNVASQFGDKAANALVAYHIANGGVSRYEKFRYLLEEILPESDVENGLGDSVPSAGQLLEEFAFQVKSDLLHCNIAPGLEELRSATDGVQWFIVSGGDQQELREVFSKRGLAHYFDGGIYGSPDTKDQILDRGIKAGNIRFPAVFLGDSVYDYQAAKRAGLDFIFVSKWSEVDNWQAFVETNQLDCVERLSDLLERNQLPPLQHFRRSMP